MQPQPVILWGRCTPDRLGSYEPFVEPIRVQVDDSADPPKIVMIAFNDTEMLAQLSLTATCAGAKPDVVIHQVAW